VGIALAGGKGIAHCHDEKILDDHIALDELATVRQLDAHGHARHHGSIAYGTRAIVSLSLQAIFLVSVLPPALRGCQLQTQSPVTLASCSGAMRIATVCASGST